MILTILLAQLAMNTASPQQTIDGLGLAGSIFGANGTDPTCCGGAWSDAQYKLFFDPASGLGLTILRIGINNSDAGYTFQDNNPGFSDQMVGCLKAKQWNSNLIVFGTAWSANNACKSNGLQAGGTFLPSCNASWSAFLASAATEANNVGCRLSYVGLQNEPDNSATFASMGFTPAAAIAFVKVLGPALAAITNPPGLMCCDAAQWNNNYTATGGSTNYIDAVTADSTALSSIAIWSTHAYGAPFGTVAVVGALSGRRLWQTEASWLDGATNDLMTGTGGALATAIVMHNAFVTGGASAWVSWWGVSANNPNDDGLIDFGGTISKRYYVLGNWSKFVRPGMVRFPLTGSPPTNVLVSSYKDPTSNNIAIVAINNQGVTQALTVTLDATSKCRVVTPWVTDATHNLTSVTPLTVAASAFTYTLSANSVTTFACNGT